MFMHLCEDCFFKKCGRIGINSAREKIVKIASNITLPEFISFYHNSFGCFSELKKITTFWHFSWELQLIKFSAHIGFLCLKCMSVGVSFYILFLFPLFSLVFTIWNVRDAFLLGVTRDRLYCVHKNCVAFYT